MRLQLYDEYFDDFELEKIEEEDEGSYLHQDKEDISSDDEIDFDNLENYLSVVQENPADGDLIASLVDLLERHQHFRLAYQATKIGLEFNPINDDLIEALNRLPPESNPTLYNLLKNTWFTSQSYKFTTSMKIQPLTKENLSLNLTGLIEQPNKIPSLPDLIALIPPNQEYFIFRNFQLEKFQMYLLRCRCGSSPNLNTFLHVITQDNTVRLNHKLTRSLIQYKFNSLNLNNLLIGLKGTNRDGIGQLRLMEMSLEKISDFKNESIIRSLSPKFPVVGTIVVEPSQVEGLPALLQSINPYLDQINFYLHNWNIEIPSYLKHSKIKAVIGKKNLAGLFHWCQSFVGYQFLLTPDFIYHQDYFPLMISKIQQYQHQGVIGLRGIQITDPAKKKENNESNENESNENESNENESNENESNREDDGQITNQEIRKIIPSTFSINQDIKCHLIGLESLAYFTGAIFLKSSEFNNSELAEIQLGIMGQKQEVPFICVERVESLVNPNPKINIRPEREITPEIYQLLLQQQWKFF